MKNLKFIFFTITLLLTATTSNAWHLTGGEMTYECLGNNQYQITILVYRDATTQVGANFDNPMMLSVFDGNGQVLNDVSSPILLPHNNVSPVPNTNFCATNIFGLEVATYVTTLTLPVNTSGYHISYQRCCLNVNITNIFNPNNYGMTLTTFISPLALTHCNSSPQFNNNGASTLCIGSTITMDYSGTDINGDSLAYSFSEPYNGLNTQNPVGVAVAPPYSYVPFIPPYSVNQPLGANVTIDSTTGIISGILNNAGNYYFCVKIADYQNGVLLSETRRIFLINAVPCNFATQNIDIDICTGESFSVGDKTYTTTGSYQVSTQSSTGCDTLVNLDLNVFPEIALSDTTISHDDGNSIGAVSFQLVDSTANYTYLWSNGDTTSSINNVAFGIYTVIVTNDNGCSETFEFEVLLDVNTKFIKNENFDIHIFPNPILATDFISINITAIEKSEVEIQLININGQILKTLNQTVQKGENRFKTNLNLPKGVYYFLIKDTENQLIERLPIVIQ